MILKPIVMPVLRGSPKQVAWAETVCAKRIPELLALAGNDCERTHAEALILQTTFASWWIDRRGKEVASLAQSLVEDFSNQVPHPIDGSLEPDMEADVVLATDLDQVIAKTRAIIERQPGYRYSSVALSARITAGLAPGDTWNRTADLKVVYLGNRKIMVQRLGVFRIALETRVVEATEKQLDEMLIALGRRAAITALTKMRIDRPMPPGTQEARLPTLPTTVLRRILVLADSIEVGSKIDAEADSLIEAIQGFEGGVVVDLGKPFFGRRDEAKDLLVQFAYVQPPEAGYGALPGT